jgi:hypothetical protein
MHTESGKNKGIEKEESGGEEKRSRSRNVRLSKVSIPAG